MLSANGNFFDNSLKDQIYNLNKFITSNIKKDLTIGCLELSNIATILYSYGMQVSHVTINKLMQIFDEHFAHEGVIECIGMDQFAFVTSVPYLELSGCLRSLNAKLRLFADQLPQQPIYLHCHMGVSQYNHQYSLEQNLSNAYIALFEARNKVGWNISYFPEIEENMLSFENQLKLAAYFQKVIHKKRLKLAYQPIICSKTGKVKHYEALLRIITEDNKIISAGPFIPIAESMGYIDQIDHLVLELVAEELHQSPNVTLALNVSNLSIDNNEWLNKAKTLFRDPLVASRAIIEIKILAISPVSTNSATVLMAKLRANCNKVCTNKRLS